MAAATDIHYFTTSRGYWKSIWKQYPPGMHSEIVRRSVNRSQLVVVLHMVVSSVGSRVQASFVAQHSAL
jgi:hypothetical protein